MHALAPSSCRRVVVQGTPAVWFRLHRGVQCAGLALTILALCIAIAMTEIDGKDHFGGVHGQLGLAVTLAGVAQPLNALLRPKPNPRTLGRKV